MLYIAPSLLAADYSNLREEIRRIEEAGANYLHLDIMDGHFVPNISFGAGLVSSIRKHTKLYFDVHLMISDPLRYVDDFIRAGADIITFHYESVENPIEVLRRIKAKEIRCGIAISPHTPAEVLFPFVDEADMLLVMTVEPGFGGQSLIPECLDKAKALRRYAMSHNIGIDIQADGGITPENAGNVVSSGVNILVAGSAIFKSKKPRAVMQSMRQAEASHPFL